MATIEASPDNTEAYQLAITALLEMSKAGYAEIDTLLAQAVENLPDAGALVDETLEAESQLSISIPFVPDTGDETEMNTSGNLSGNLFMGGWQGGLFASQGAWTYFSSNLDNMLYKIKAADLTGLQKVCDDSACFINVIGDTIYYCNTNENNAVYSIRTDGENRMKLSDGFCEYLSVENGWIYYGTEDSAYRMRTDGSEKTQLVSVQTKYPYASGDWLYYLEKSERGGLWRVPVFGGKPEEIISDTPVEYVLSGDRIYYLADASDGMKIYRVEQDGSTPVEIYAAVGKIDVFNVYGDQMFIMDRPPDSAEQAIVVLNLDTNEIEHTITGYGTDQLYCAEKLLIFITSDDEQAMRVELNSWDISNLLN